MSCLRFAFVFLLSPLASPWLFADTGPLAPEGNTGRYPLSTASAKHAMVVTGNHYASAAAAEIIRAGGSAIDAAIAAQAVLGLVEPQSSGLGGGAFMVYHDGKNTLSIDGRETAPASAKANRFLDHEGQPLPFYTAVASGRGVGVPGVLAALETAHKRYGRLPWKKLFSPAITLSRHGFMVSERLHVLIDRDPLLRTKTKTHEYFFDKNGEAIATGYLLKNPAYANTLQRIADSGAKEFYQGRTGRNMIKSLNALGADISNSDWSNYTAKIGPALCRPYQQLNICTTAPPSGGWTVLQTLAIFEKSSHDHNDGSGHSDAQALRLHRLLEAERLSFADRQRYSADADFVPVPLTGLLEKNYINNRAALINDKSMHTANAGIPEGLAPPWGTDGQLLENGTTQLVIADAHGHWLSMTSSIEDSFGSRLLIDGILLNNQLTDFSFLPAADGHAMANRVQAGKRPRSAMAPVIVFDAQQKPILALGSPGGSRIIGYVLRALVNLIDEGLTPAQTVSQPMILSRNGPTEIDSDFPGELRNALEAHEQTMTNSDLNSGLAIIKHINHHLEAAADPRREGKAAGF